MNLLHAFPVPHALVVGLLLVGVALVAAFALLWIALAIDWSRVPKPSRPRRRAVEAHDTGEAIEPVTYTYAKGN